jgi:acetyl esterase/lipase
MTGSRGDVFFNRNRKRRPGRRFAFRLALCSILIVEGCNTTPTPTASVGPLASSSQAAEIGSPSPSATLAPTNSLAPLPSPSPSEAAPIPPPADPCGPNGIFCGPYGWTASFNVPFTQPIDCGTSGSCDLEANVYQPVVRPDSPPAPTAGWPLIVTIPGGPAAPGARDGLSGLAAGLTVKGVVVVSADWRQAPNYGGGYPTSFEDVSCVIRWARTQAKTYGADASRVTLVAHSFGGLPGAVVTLAAKAIPSLPVGCLASTGSVRPDVYVGIAPVSTLDMIGQDFLATFLGGTRSEAPTAWDASDPLVLAAGDGAPNIPIRFMIGSGDFTVTAEEVQPLVDQLLKDGRDVQLSTLAGAGHQDLLTNPATLATVATIAQR